MLTEPLFDVPAILALALQTDGDGSWLTAPSGADFARMILRWGHFVFGIAWIGMLYFFNLVNVPLMKELDGPTKGIVIPKLMPRALWYFRWGALGTVFVGLTYFAMYILPSDARAAGTTSWNWLGQWFLIVLVLYAVIYFVIQKINDGRVLAVCVAVISIVFCCLNVYLFKGNKTIAIGIGGGLGMFMLLNVWGIIWRAQKRIIAWTEDNAKNGTPIPAESAQLARRAFLASRTNAWLSLPMLLLMGISHGDYIMFIK
ncbi:MAG: urate hydroxylase PuuD [Acidobacteria bacterium]|nr:urate hydroxylase PuuD [Acidobacteriota bacterium]